MNSKLDNIRKIILILYIFSLPISVAANNILLGVIILYWLIWGDKKETLRYIKENPIVIAFYILFFIFAVSVLWSDNLHQAFRLLRKELSYLALPIFMTLMKKEEIDTYIKSFLSAMFISEFLSYLIFLKIIPPILHATTFDPVPFMGPTGHISYNPMLVLSIYLLIYLFFKQTTNRFYKAVSILFILTMTVNLFITGGRAGQVAFFVMLIVIALEFFKLNIKTFILSIVAIFLIFFTAYNSSEIFHKRVNLAISEVQNFKSNPNTSVGMRLATWQSSIELIKEHPFMGSGIGDYVRDIKEYGKKHTPNAMVLPQPHNMYLFAWAHSGVFALIALLAIFYFQIRGYFVIDDEYKPIRLALPILFLIIMFSESYLSVHYTKILFLLFTAMLYKDLKWQDVIKSS